ncbi:hypothetical protein ACPPVO_08200 [Dactylosporangium sp. McL0621]|uniref:hypothetical protein n=1 Tax=Dactylosporangium sp. McL0621 TaxID=3415678 RepID=UPI003CF0CCCB
MIAAAQVAELAKADAIARALTLSAAVNALPDVVLPRDGGPVLAELQSLMKAAIGSTWWLALSDHETALFTAGRDRHDVTCDRCRRTVSVRTRTGRGRPRSAACGLADCGRVAALRKSIDFVRANAAVMGTDALLAALPHIEALEALADGES